MLMDEPQYPSVQGQAMPDLGLARYGSVDTHAQLPVISDSTAPVDCSPPPLQHSDLSEMGLDPTVPATDLQLANAFRAPTPSQLAAPHSPGAVNPPSFALPDMTVPPLASGDLARPNIDWRTGLAPDPALADLLAYPQPGGMEIFTARTPSFSLSPDLTMSDRPAGLSMPGPLTPDPTLPDLTDPILPSSLPMPARPGELAEDALAEMHADPTYAQLPSQEYQSLWMQQPGQNAHRIRKQGMLMLGLEQEERDA